MHTLNAFVEIPALADNAIEKIGKFGELSVKARTYTKDIRNFVDKSAYPNIELTTFDILDEKSKPVANPPTELTNIALRVSNFFYTQYSNNAIPLPTSKPTLVTAIGAEVSEIRNIHIGEILGSDVPSKRLIDYIMYDCVVESIVWRVTLWFSDSKFRLQYPGYDVVVIPPVGDVGRLIDVPSTVLEAINSVTIDYTINRIAAITNEHSATTVYTHTLRWHDPDGGDSRIVTKWTMVIYGAAGHDLDVVKDAIRQYLSDNHPSDKWVKIFPDLYSENEFLLMPFWNLLSTPVESYDDGLYSSIVNWSDMNSQADRLIPKSYIGAVSLDKLKKNYTCMVATMYRGMSMLAVGNPNNIGGHIRFKPMFPDYMAVASDRPDFARMSNLTQEFVLILLEVMEMARRYTLNTVLPAGFIKTSKGNREYIGFDYEGFTYYVLTRLGYLKNL